jgi:predicted MFS family arabinose efflux permease
VVFAAAMVSVQFGPAMVQKLGPIRTSQVCLLTTAAGLLLMGVPHIPAAFMGALLIGTGCGPIMPASSEMLARSTSPRHFALVFSLKQTGVPLGGAAAALIVPPALLAAGALGALALMSGLCLLAAALAQVLRSSLDDRRDPSTPMPRFAQLGRPVRAVLADAKLRPLALSSVLLCAVQLSLTSYVVVFLISDLGWGIVAAGVGLAVAQGAGMAGRVGWGWLADGRTGAARTMGLLTLAMAAAAAAMTLLQPATPSTAALLLLGLFGATAIGWNGVFFATVARLAPQGDIPLATAGTVFFNYLGVAVGPPLFGLVAAWRGSHAQAFGALAVLLFVMVFVRRRGLRA